MQWNVETHITRCEIEQIGKDQAIARATFTAWLRVLGDTHPERSIVLRSTTIDEGREHTLGPYAYRCRFIFEVD